MKRRGSYLSADKPTPRQTKWSRQQKDNATVDEKQSSADVQPYESTDTHTDDDVFSSSSVHDNEDSDQEVCDGTDDQEVYNAEPQEKYADDEVEPSDDLEEQFGDDVRNEFDDLSPNKEDSTSSSDKDKPLYSGSRLTVAASMLLITAFVVRHGLSGVATMDLLQLIELHCLADNLCITSYQIYQNFFCQFRLPIKFTYYCGNCTAYHGQDEVDECPICKKSDSRKSFISIGLQDQIKEIISKPGIRSKLQFSSGSTGIGDITDGTVYRNATSTQQHRQNSANNTIHLTLQLNTDGVALLRWGKFSVWPLYGTINELPPSMRFSRENRLFLGLWFGEVKPTMRIFLKPVVDELNELAKTGISLKEDNLTIQLVSVVSDAPARCLVQSMVQFNGQYGCPNCYMHGESQKTDKGHVFTFPYDNSDEYSERGYPVKRSHTDTVAYGLEAEQALMDGKKVDTKGLQGLPVLASVPSFDVIEGMALDYMHLVPLGIGKMFLGLWLDTKHKLQPWFIGGANGIRLLENKLSSIITSSFIHRPPKDIKSYSSWKASQVRAWILYCSASVLYNVLPDVYYAHFVLLISSMHILLSQEISASRLLQAEFMLAKFCREFGELYHPRYYTSNMHGLLHLVDKVRALGPLWANSCFFYEDLNGDLRNMFHGTRHIPQQIMHACNVQYTLPKALDIINVGEEAANFFDRLLGPGLRFNYEKICDGYYAIGSMNIFKPEADILRALANMEAQTIYKFLRLRVNNWTIKCREYIMDKTHQDHVICFNLNGSRSFGTVNYFIKTGSLYLAYVRKYNIIPNGILDFTSYSDIFSTPLEVSRGYEVVVIDVRSIVTLCMLVDIGGQVHAIAPPNSVERE